MNGKSTYTIVPPSPVRSVQDEWGLFDPDQAGIKAAIRAVRALNTPTIRGGAPEPMVRQSAPEPTFRDTASEQRVRDDAPNVPARHEQVYELGVPEPEPQTDKPETKGAVYALEFPTMCPQCGKKIGEVHVSRLLRTQVSFTSTLPRKGYIILCPECDGILSAELSGLI